MGEGQPTMVIVLLKLWRGHCSIVLLVLLVTGSIVLLVVYDIVYIVVSLERKDDGCTLLVIRLKLVFLRSLLNWMAATNSHSSSNLLEFFDLLNLNASFLLGYLSCIHPKNYGYVPHCTFCWMRLVTYWQNISSLPILWGLAD